MRNIIIALLLASVSCAAAQQAPQLPVTAITEVPNWHLFTQSHGGTVSLLHGLTKHACEFAMNRALGRPATDEEKAREPLTWRWGSTTSGPGTIIRAECFQ